MSALSYKEKQKAIKFTKDHFTTTLADKLNLIEVSAPVLVKQNDGTQDGLNGTETPVSIKIKCIPQETFEIVHSLAKWKRFLLAQEEFQEGEGIYTNMLALRPDEETLDALHSVTVDQWDWEKVIDQKDRSLDKLKTVVKDLYQCILKTHHQVSDLYSLPKFLPEEITFVHAEDLAKQFPKKTSKEREREACKQHGAVFVIGIGGDIGDGTIHDGRAPDYDDWTTPTTQDYKGLNGDILVWNPLLEDAFEISSMGIRVDKDTLIHQTKLKQREELLDCPWHQSLLNDELPQTIGGGIGKSRLLMLLLQQKHIGDIQPSAWPS